MTLQQNATPGLFAGWRERVRRTSNVTAHPAAAMFDETVLDLFTVIGPTTSLNEGVEALLRARSDQQRSELVGAASSFRHQQGYANRRPGGRTLGAPARDRGDRRELVRFLHEYHRVAIAPYWPRIRSRLQAEHTGYARALAAYGVEAMFALLPPGFHWRSPVLAVGRGGPVTDLELSRRGLVLVPSVFCQTTPSLFTNAVDDRAPAILVVPVLRTVADATSVLTPPDAGTVSRALAALLGRTRANALDVVGQGACTTGQLAGRLGVSLANASEHATVLRQAGLLSTSRRGRAVLHTLTPLGADLLDGRHAGALELPTTLPHAV
ncbi:ArsR/SmtB family transcription factor [Micromonospora sp. NPDC050397]|uniref:ArsR/SmtB family transcription factor n=1 Tax=Micromonospora sp. NPDC050397 TaxID=3364279 RepID=UPI00384FF2D6